MQAWKIGDRKVLLLTGVVLLGWATSGWCASLGIALDDFLADFEKFVIALGLIMGLLGLAGYIMGQYESTWGTMLGGSLSFFIKAGLFGGGSVLLGALGLVSGAVLP